ncbi:methyltransferase family protein [Halopiger djelfimassiliensis]|uniref:methyltransferase family protein n=1 Tax=Halopiger djelfimassiliensis TaxID=1293047 RepID=UPI0006781B30|nr:PEMT/PEM2 methyltransferase family protein [Halopiger djelfimassiliensis]
MTGVLTSGVFAVGVLLTITNLGGIVASAFGLCGYWPPGERNWAYYTHWGISHALNAVMLALTVLDWNSLGLPRGPSLIVGAVVFVAGYGVAIASGLDLGVEETKGLAGELRTGGWYRYSRNPQYVGYLVATVGFAVLTNSTLVAVVCAIYMGWWLALPFAEEPWLRERYGEDYERYAERVPRFLGRETLRALVDRDTAAASGSGT